MKIYGYDEQMNKIGEIKYVQVLWNRKNFEPGTFLIYQQLQHYVDVAYIKAEGRREIGIVYKPNYANRINGMYVTIEGKFAEDIANGSSTKHGRTLVTSKSLNAQFMDELKGQPLKEGANSELINGREGVLERCLQSGTEIYRILQLEQESFNVDWLKGWKINFVKPKNKGLRFSKGLGNVKEIAYTKDMSGYKHRCIGYVEIPKDVIDDGYSGATNVGGRYYEVGEYVSTLDVPELYKTREISVDFCLPEGLDIKKENKAKIRKQIVQMCKLELLNHYVSKEISVVPAQADGCRYLEDYDLGDLVELEIPEIGIVYNAQIIEVNETWEKNMKKQEIVLGHKKVKR